MTTESPDPTEPIECDQLAIHAPGSIQPHGALLAVDLESLTIRQVSANTADFLGYAPERLLGRPIGDIFDLTGLTALLAPASPHARARTPRPVRADIVGGDGERRTVACMAHVQGRHIIVEILPEGQLGGGVAGLQSLRQRALIELTRPETVSALCDVIALTFRLLTGYDRVMVYFFHPDDHGEVIAERTDQPNRYFGLHYPASDIPAPARALYRQNLIRMIADVADEPVRLLAGADTADPEPLDLSFSQLRSVAPVHLDYLRAMGVKASMSTSLIVDGRLWGLVACHHGDRKVLPADLLHLCELLSQIASTFIERMQNAERLNRILLAQQIASDLERVERSDEDSRAVLDILRDNAAKLQQLIAWDGLVAHIGGQVMTLGDVPTVLPDLTSLLDRTDDGLIISERLVEQIALETEQSAVFAGGAFVSLSADGDYLFLGRHEWQRRISWAGKPCHVVRTDAEGHRSLGPRRSFEAWQESVSGRSLPFRPDDRDALAVIRRTLLALRAAERERNALAAKQAAERNEAALRIQLLHSARLSSMGELASGLAHEINQPLTAVVNYVSACREEMRLIEDKLPDVVAELMDEAVEQADRAGEIVRRLRRFIEKGEIERMPLSISETIAEAVKLAVPVSFVQDVEIDWRLTDDLPTVYADKVQIEQVVFNLVRNALESMETVSPKVLTIATGQDSPAEIEVRIADTGHGLVDHIQDDLFRPFTTSKANGMGIGLSLCRSIVEAHGGMIRARNKPHAEGAEFVFTLPVSQPA
ncbi:ATP-binding protein [Marinivivus vitaminiproducens]|uniref:ATP-binding protein n=1 Tax=Marinivivus vitaminiproducens TaxID=3035935 RepID=UPI00279BB71A|nr:GAF domain-containing protein [Geminicoccaceae bacterium SCSIO 64248]